MGSNSMHIAAPPPVLEGVNDNFLVQDRRREEPLSVGKEPSSRNQFLSQEYALRRRKRLAWCNCAAVTC